jgi:hypothetical protein
MEETRKHGPTGFVRSRWDFEQFVQGADECGAYVVASRPNHYCTGEVSVSIIHFHYFKNGVELGYWSPITDLGFVFETPRVWHQPWKDALVRHSVLRPQSA